MVMRWKQKEGKRCNNECNSVRCGKQENLNISEDLSWSKVYGTFASSSPHPQKKRIGDINRIKENTFS